MMKKIVRVSLLLVAIVAFVLAMVGCGEKQATGISVTPPTKVEYEVGEELDLAGMSAELVYDDESTETISVEDLTVSGFTSEQAGTVTVTVTYQTFQDTFTVTVNEAGSPAGSKIAVDGVTFESNSVEYNGEEHTLLAADVPTGVDVVYANNVLTNAGTANATATLSAQEGYVLTVDGEDVTEPIVLEATFAVVPKTITASVVGADAIYETGNAITVEIELTGVLAGDTVNYTFTTEPQEVVAAGDYVGTVEIDNANYALASAQVNFCVQERTPLTTPNFSFRDGEIVVALIDENSDTWAYSYDGIDYVNTTEQSVALTGVGSLTVYVKAVADRVGYVDSDPISKSVYVEGVLTEYDFVTKEGEQVRDMSGNGAHLTVRGGNVTSDCTVIDNSTQTGSVAYTPQSLGYDNATSITVEVVAKVDDLVVPASGDKWYPLVYKTNEYFIGYWTVNTEPAKARLCMVLFSGNEGDVFYDGMWFDDTNFWLPLSAIEDGNYHSYAITYDEATGAVSYYMDYMQIGTATREVGDVCRYTGNSILFGGWGNLYDVENDLIGIYSSVSYKYFKVRNYAVPVGGLTNFYAMTEYVVASGSDLSFAPAENVSNLQYLTDISQAPQYGSMTFEISFVLNAADMTNGVRYTVANRGESFQLYLIKDNGHIFGQCYVRTTGANNVYGQTFLDFGAIDEYVTTFGDGVTVNTMRITFDAFTGRARGQVNDVYIDWCYKDFGGSLINPTGMHNQAFPLYVGSAAWGEALPVSTQIKSFTLKTAPVAIQAN
ncbi:MAG: bacterial Ig-like domain-containing protein [Clostridia bacterium]|nr:bacterial Ig-like domain-containing protein [Clostridia bacterium]